MFKFKNKKFYIGEKVKIIDGRLMNAKGVVVGKENDNVLVKIGTIIHMVENEIVESLENKRKKLFNILRQEEDNKLEFIGLRVASSKEELDNKFNDKSFIIIEVDEIEDYDVLLVKNK